YPPTAKIEITTIAAATLCQRRLGIAAPVVGPVAETVLACALAGLAAALVPLGGVIAATPGVLMGICWNAASRTTPDEEVGITAAETRLESVSRLSRARSVRNSAACWYRIRRSFSSAFEITSSRRGGMSGLRRTAGTGAFSR